MVEHLSKDCLERATTSNVTGMKTTLNLIDSIPSPLTFETEMEMRNIALRVVTRAQTLREKETRKENNLEGKSKPKRRRPRSKRAKSKKSSKDSQPHKSSIMDKPVRGSVQPPLQEQMIWMLFLR